MKRFKKIWHFLHKKGYILYTAIALAIVFFSLFYIYPQLKVSQNKTNTSAYKGVLQIWNIDSFEGGVGSRTSFLQNVGKVFERQNQGLFVLVTSHTQTSAKTALQKGERPDLISYGTGCDFVVDIAKPMEGHTFKAATMGGKSYAYPWAVGQYVLLSFEDNFKDVKPENTVISENSTALTTVAAATMGLHGNFAVQDSSSAYSNFVQKKFKYLLGTQRDIARLSSRNLTFYSMPISDFSNLQQYISITTVDKNKLSISQAYVDLLLSKQTQEKLTQISMLSLQQNIYTAEHPLYKLQQNKPYWTISPFLEPEKVQQLKSQAMQAIYTNKNIAQNLQKFYILYL